MMIMIMIPSRLPSSISTFRLSMVNTSMLAASWSARNEKKGNHGLRKKKHRTKRTEQVASELSHFVPMWLFSGREIGSNALPQLILFRVCCGSSPRVLDGKTPSSPLQKHALDRLVGT